MSACFCRGQDDPDGELHIVDPGLNRVRVGRSF